MISPSTARAGSLFAVCLTTLLLVACSLFGNDSGLGQDGVVVREINESILIENRRSAPIWVDMYTTGVLVAAIIAPPSFRGDSIPPGGARVTPLDSIPGLIGTSLSRDEVDIRVMWYEAEYRNGERVPPDDYNGFTID